MSVKNPKAAGFRREDVASGVDLWSQNCKIQIVRYKKNTENPVYYEIGKMYGVAGVGTGRQHVGDIGVQTSDATIETARTFSSETRMAVGDRVQSLSNILTQPFAVIERVVPRSGGGFLYVINPKCQFTGASFGNTYQVFLE